MKLSSLPRGGRILFGFTVAAGVAAVAVRVPEATRWTGSDLLTLAGLALATFVTEQFSVPLRLRTETLNFTLTDAAWTAGLILARPSVLIAAVVVGVVAGQRVKRWEGLKIAFNVGTYLVAGTAAQLVYSAFGPFGARDPEAWGAAVAAMMAFAVVNIALVNSIVSIVEHKPFSRLVSSTLALDLAHRVGNSTIGVAFAVVRTVNPLIVFPVLGCLALAYLAYEAWVQTIRERDEIRALYEVERHLLAPIESTADLEPVLEVVRRMLRADRVELSLLERDGAASIGGPASIVASSAGPDEDGARRGEHEQDGPTQIALVGTPDGVSGILIVHRERPMANAERSLLESVASKVSVMVRNARLYQETLEQAELAGVVSHTWDGIFVVSAEGVILSWNPSMERITGLGQADVAGRSCRDLLGIAIPDSLTRTEGNAGEPGSERDTVLNKRDGTKRWLNYSLHRLGERAGRRNVAVVVRDVTAELETEQLKADFVATVSHELRTPLTPLKGFLITLLHGMGDGTSEERRGYYQIMLNQANRLERLITDLLEASRIESGEPIVDLRPLDVVAEVRTVVETFQEQYPDRAFTLGGPDEMIVVGDPLRIDQVVTNLVSNAVKYSPRSEPIEVTISSSRGEAVVRVRDHGQGISAPDRERIFERFFRVDNALTRSTGGTGLGLYLARKLALAMRGRLEVSSVPGRGSTFSLTLPLNEAALSSLPRSGGRARARRRAPQAATACPSRRDSVRRPRAADPRGRAPVGYEREDRHRPPQSRARRAGPRAFGMGPACGSRGILDARHHRPSGLPELRVDDRPRGRRRIHRAHRPAHQHPARSDQEPGGPGEGGCERLPPIGRKVHAWHRGGRTGRRLRHREDPVRGAGSAHGPDAGPDAPGLAGRGHRGVRQRRESGAALGARRPPPDRRHQRSRVPARNRIRDRMDGRRWEPRPGP